MEYIAVPNSVIKIGNYLYDFGYPAEQIWIAEKNSYAHRFSDEHSLGWMVVDPSSGISLPESANAVESQAFAETVAESIYVPSGVTEIADDAFDADVVIITPFESYAMTWADEKGLFCLTK